MNTETTGAEANATLATESVQSGEVDNSTSTKSGESAETASGEKGTKGTEGLFDGMDAPTLHKSYKSLQSQYTKMNEAIKKLDKFGGLDRTVQWAEFLASDDDFPEWVKKKQMKLATGIQEEEMDEPTKKAYETVGKIADAKAEAKVREALQKEVAPLAEAYRQELLDKHFDSMDKKYGKEWNEMLSKMSELSAELPQKTINKPTFKDIEKLYINALVETGKFDSFAAKQYQKVLTEKKAKSTEKPGGNQPSAPVKYKSIQESYEAAKRALST